ncbi:hypothetical protein H5410_026132, partial [Solanum commersonii]
MLPVVRKLKIMKYGLNELNNREFRSNIVSNCQEDREAMMKAQQLLQNLSSTEEQSYMDKTYDDNIKYLFSVIKHRSLQQATNQLKDDSRNWHTDPELIGK